MVAWDWSAYGERWYVETYAQAVDLTGRDYGSLANMTYVAKQVDFSRRREKLSWSHHQEVAPLEPDEQDTWLELAESKHGPVLNLGRRFARHATPMHNAYPPIQANHRAASSSSRTRLTFSRDWRRRPRTCFSLILHT